MSKIEFSDEQKVAIKSEGHNCLVSAGAGSGKTAVLTERIYTLVKKYGRIDNFLVLTFTNLAAAEMKERIRERLNEDEDTKKFAVEVDNTHIETFDAFYLYIAKKYFHALGISKDVTIIDNAIIEIKRRQLVDTLFSALANNKDPDFINLMKAFSLKNNDDLKSIVLKVLSESDKKVDKKAFFNSLEKNYSSKEYIDSVINDSYELIRKKIRFILEKLNANRQYLEAEDAGKIADIFYALLNIEGYSQLTEAFQNINYPRKPSKYEGSGEIRDAISSFFKEKVAKIKYPTVKEIEEAITKNSAYVNVIIKIAREIDQQIDEYKSSKNAYNFVDISRMVLTLLKDEAIVKELKDRFDFIMVDEYQDTNDIQESVLNIIGKNNVYMVGDIKQSIYRFRNADCKIFNRKFLEYKSDPKKGEEIDLNESFRSRKDVVDFINDLFSKLMVLEFNPIDYSKGHNFGFGRKEYGPNDIKYQTEELRYQYSVSSESIDKEKTMIINDIIDKHNNKFEVYDVKLKKNRPVEFKDFAIIIDREGEFDKFTKALSEAGIPVNSRGKERLMKSDINVAISSLVKMLYYALNEDFGNDYKHAYLSVARSFLVEESDQNLYKTFEKDSHSLSLVTPLGQKIELIKERLRFASLEEVLKTLFEEFQLYEKVIKIGNYYANVHKAESLLRYASQMDALGMGIVDLVDYFNNLNEYDLDIEYRDGDSQDDSVTLINIHQSKGLEYNIIYYPRLNKQFNLGPFNEKYQISSKYGVILPVKNLITKGLNYYIARTEDLEERIRVLYVALTRAKQKIILLIGEKDDNKFSYSMPYEAKSLKEVYQLADLKDKYFKEYTLGDEILPLNVEIKKEIVPLNIELKQIKVDSEIKQKKHASKEVVKVDESLLRFGSEVHALLEGLDLSNRDTSYIKDYKFRRIANNVINSGLFKGIRNDQVRHEFSYYDKENNVNGVIDCLIIKDNEIDIIDFKLKNIAEEDYDKQLKTYKAYISSISDKPIKMYLLAALTGEVREVKDE